MKSKELQKQNCYGKILRQKAYDKLRCYVATKKVTYSKRFNRRAYKKRIEKELRVIREGNFEKTFLTAQAVTKKAQEYATTKTFFSFDWLVGYLLGITDNNPIEKTPPQWPSVYLEVTFNGGDESFFVDYIVTHGFYKPLDEENVYLLNEESVFIQINIE